MKEPEETLMTVYGLTSLQAERVTNYFKGFYESVNLLDKLPKNTGIDFGEAGADKTVQTVSLSFTIKELESMLRNAQAGGSTEVVYTIHQEIIQR